MMIACCCSGTFFCTRPVDGIVKSRIIDAAVGEMLFDTSNWGHREVEDNCCIQCIGPIIADLILKLVRGSSRMFREKPMGRRAS